MATTKTTTCLPKPLQKAIYNQADSKKGSIDDNEDLLSDVNSMLLSEGVPIYSMDFKLSFIISVYNDVLDQMVKVKVFIPILSKEFFIPDVIFGRKKVSIKIQVALFFVDERHVIQSNKRVVGFNQNMHQAQAFKDWSEAVLVHYNMMIDSIYGTSMEIAMPFVIEERIVAWEIQAYLNDLGNLEKYLGCPQFLAVLSVVVQKLRNKRLNIGSFRVTADNA